VLTIYDAEMYRPTATYARRWRRSDKQLQTTAACKPGSLFQREQTSLPGGSRAEYVFVVWCVLPLRKAANSVVALGPQYMPVRILRKSAAGTSFNVPPKNADLGVRLARHGYRTQILDLWEEANS